ncbi:Gldg family protein [Planctomycetota bacterium]
MNDSIFRRLLAVFFILLTGGSVTYLASVWGRHTRLDLTESRLYTLSDATVQILTELDSTVTLRLYYSKTAARKSQTFMRRFNNYAKYVQDILQEYQNVSPAKITVHVIDPRPDTDEEQDAVRYDITRYQLSEDESFFFGAVALGETGLVKQIPVFDLERENFVEYDLAKLVISVQDNKKSVVGILSSLPVVVEDLSPFMMQMMMRQGKRPPRPWYIKTALEDFFEIKRVDKPEDFAELDVLLVIHPRDLDDHMMFAIDQHVVNGGNTIILTDPMYYLDETKQDPYSQFSNQNPTDASNLNNLLEPWGLRMLEKRFAGDLSLAQPLGMGRNFKNTPNLAGLFLNDKCVNPDDVICGQLDDIFLLTCGILEPTHGDDIDGQAILTTTVTGSTFFAPRWELGNPEEVLKTFLEGTKEVIVGYKMTGLFNSTFEAAPPPKEDDKDEDGGDKDKKDEEDSGKKAEPLPHVKDASKKATLVVIADVDFLNDNIAFQRSFLGSVHPQRENVFVLLNGLEALCSGSSLMEIRSRGKFRRDFTRVREIEKEAELKNRERLKEIQAQKDEFEAKIAELREQAGSGQTDHDLLQNKANKEEKDFRKKIAGLDEEERELNRHKREDIEALGGRMQFFNTFLVPIFLSLWALWLGFARRIKMKAYLGKHDEG